MTIVRAEWDRAAGWALIAAGLVCGLLAYAGVAGSSNIAAELTYLISGGLGGLTLLGAGGTLLIVADLHDEWRKLSRIEAAIHGSSPPAARRLPPPIARAGFLLLAGFAGAAVVLLIAWDRAAGVADAKPAFQDVGLGVIALIVAGAVSVGVTLWLKTMLKRRQSQLLAPWELADLTRRLGLAAVSSNGTAAGSYGDLVLARGLSRYHRAGCAAVDGLATRGVARDRLPRELEPCQLCEAGDPS